MFYQSEDDREEVYKSTTRATMNAISRLFAKHQTDPTRCTALLLLPLQMDLDLYLEMRQVTNYEQLWDDITRQFVSHSDIYLLEKAMEAIGALRRTEALSATNAEKVTALEMAVIGPLRQLIDGVDANNATPLDEDAIKKITAWLARLCLILKNWDVTPSLIEPSLADAPTILEAVNQLVERGQMGFHEEEKVRRLQQPKNPSVLMSILHNRSFSKHLIFFTCATCGESPRLRRTSPHLIA